MTDELQTLVDRFHQEVLDPVADRYVGKEEVVDVLGLGLVAGENVFLLGPPGTAKSALVLELARRVGGRSFEYLLTRFTEPNELFGPYDLRKLREGELVTHTENMLPEAHLVFLDELLNASSAILNSLLTVLNERVLRRGREVFDLPTLMVVAASNRLPEDETLAALFDRFLLRVHCGNVRDGSLEDVLRAGWALEGDGDSRRDPFSLEDVRTLQGRIAQVSLDPIRGAYAQLVRDLRRAGLEISDRRAVKVQRLVAGSALLCGRTEANPSDLWVLRYLWDAEEEQRVLDAMVGDFLAQTDAPDRPHRRALALDRPAPRELERELARLEAAIGESGGTEDRTRLRKRLSEVDEHLDWVPEDATREALARRSGQLWDQLEDPTEDHD